MALAVAMPSDPQDTRLESLLSEMGWVHSLARSLVRDPSDADDLAQDAWLASLQRKHRSAKLTRGWFVRVLNNRLRTLAVRDDQRPHRERAGARPEPLRTPEELARRMESQHLLAAAVMRLAEPYRSTVILRYSEGLEPSEIARSQGVAPSTVRSQLKRALETLRADLDKSFEGGREAWSVALMPFALQASPGTVGKTSVIAGGTLIMNKVFAGVSLVALVGGVWLIKDYLVSETPIADQVAVEDDSSTAAGHPSELALDDATGERAERSQRDGVVEPRMDADALEAILSRALVFCEPRFRQAVEGRTAQEVAHQRRLVALLNSPDLGTNSRAVRALQGMPLTTDMAEKIAAYADEQNQVQASQAAVVLAIDPTGSGQPELAKLLLAEYSELLENPYVTQRHKVSAILGAVGELLDAAGELAESEPFLGALRKIAEDFEREPEISRNGVDENEQLRSVAGQALTILCRSGTLPFDQIITELTGADGPIRTRVLGALVERGHGFSADERKALVAALPRDLFVSTSSSENELLLAATCGDPRVPDYVERQFADAEPASMHYLMRLQAGYCRAGASDAVASLTKYARTSDVLLVRRALGHRSLASTMVYARVDERQLRKVLS